MPEAPEVRTDADDLDFILYERDLVSVELTTGLFDKIQGLDELKCALPLKVLSVKSRAKKIFMRLSSKEGKNWYVIFYYGMTGGLTTLPHVHNHVMFEFSHCWVGFDKIYYRDTRRIGSIIMTSDEQVYRNEVTDMAMPIIGYEDHEDFYAISEKDFVEAVKTRGKKKYLLSAIMDQRTICSGIGNYLASEIFHESEFDPWVHCHELTDDQIRKFYLSAIRVVEHSLQCGGNSLSDYLNITGKKGGFSEFMKVYNKEGKKDDLGREIIKTKGPHGRSIYYVAR